jgi:hypothetical protein
LSSVSFTGRQAGRPVLQEQQQEQLERTSRRRLEFEVCVELASCLNYGVHHHCADCNDVRSLLNQCQGVEKQRFTEAFALLVLVYSQAGKKHDADWVIRRSRRRYA